MIACLKLVKNIMKHLLCGSRESNRDFVGCIAMCFIYFDAVASEPITAFCCEQNKYNIVYIFLIPLCLHKVAH